MKSATIQMTPGDDTHLTLLMAPQSLNFVTGQDRESLLAFGRAAFKAGQGTRCLLQIAEPAAPQAAKLSDWRTPTKYLDRLGDAMQLLCSGKRPGDDLLTEWINDTNEKLQDFACEHGPAWAQGIGLIDAAMVMARQPTEGVAKTYLLEIERMKGWM